MIKQNIYIGDTKTNFTWAELSDSRTGLIRPSPVFARTVLIAQDLRDFWGAPLAASGIRTPRTNAFAGGAGNSQHLLFVDATRQEIEADPDGGVDRFAIDLHYEVGRDRPVNFADFIRELTAKGHRIADGDLHSLATCWLGQRAMQVNDGMGGVGLYDWGLHIDGRSYPAFWDNRDTPGAIDLTSAGVGRIDDQDAF